MTEVTCPALRLRATITIDLEATDYREAAFFQERVERHFQTLARDYSNAEVVVRERRRRTPHDVSPASVEANR